MKFTLISTRILALSAMLSLIACATTQPTMSAKNIAELEKRRARIQEVITSKNTIDCNGADSVSRPDKKPLVKLPAIFPKEVNENGHCLLKFSLAKNVSPPLDMQTLSCTNPAFELPAKRALAKWRYQPTFKNGELVNTCDVTARIEFSR